MALPDADKAAKALQHAELLRPVLGVEPIAFAPLSAMLELSHDPLLRLMALLPSADAAQVLATTLRLSKKQTMRLIKAMQMPLDLTALAKVLYFDGAQAVADRALLARATGETDPRLDEALALAAAYKRPKFPLTGAMMQKVGMADGPQMGQMAFVLEQWWVAEGFPDIVAVEAELKKRV